MSERRFGDEQAGFTLGHDDGGIIHSRAWGFWSAETGRAFGTIMLDACRQSNAVRLVLDMSELKPMREEGQASFAKLVGALTSLGIGRLTVILTSQLMKLQLLRIAGEVGAGGLVEFTSPNAQELRR